MNDKTRNARLKQAMIEANSEGDMVHMTVRIFEDDLERMKCMSAENDVNVSSIIRASIHYYLSDLGYY